MRKYGLVLRFPVTANTSTADSRVASEVGVARCRLEHLGNAITFQLSDHGRFPASTTKPGDLSEYNLENYDEDNKAGLGLFMNVKGLAYHRDTEDVVSPPEM
jgi:hypothetical protein